MGSRSAEPAEAGGFGYRPALDGVRGLAIGAVLLFHGGVTFMRGGFLGVDAFFVLSGFLITSLLLAEDDQHGRIRLRAFWGRRARRLLPALLLMLVCVVPVARYLVPDLDPGLLRGDGLAVVGYVANWRMIYRGTDYFTQNSTPSLLQHTWSLGIEEQFYLLWPVLVVVLLAGLAKRGTARLGLLAVAGCGAAVSAVVMGMVYRQQDVNRAYFGTDSRAQALLVGCAVAVLVASWQRRARHAAPDRDAGPARHPVVGGLAVLGALGVGYLWTHASGTAGWMYHGGFAIGALAVAAVLAHATVSPGSWTARLLAVPPLVWLGRISYGVYLWHWPLYQFVDAEHTGLAGPGLLLARIGLTLAVATVSYVALERPVLRRRWPGAVRTWRAARGGHREGRPSSAGARLKPAMATVAALGLTLATITLATAPSLTGSGSTAAVAPVIPPPLPAGSVHPSQQQPPMRRPGRRPGTQPRVTILGDSVAWTLGAYLPPHPGIQVDNKATQGCGIALLPEILELGQPATNYPYCDTWPSKYGAAVHADDPDVVVLLYDRWELMDRKLDGVYQHVGQAPFDAYLSGQLDRAVRIAAGRGALVVLLTAPYTHRAEAPSGGLYPEDQPSRVDAWNALVRKVAAAHPGNAMVLDLNRLVCPGGQFAWRVDGMRVRSDGLHFTPVGVQRLIAPWLLPRLATIAASGQP